MPRTLKTSPETDQCICVIEMGATGDENTHSGIEYGAADLSNNSPSCQLAVNSAVGAAWQS
jgi:hypothetical protein